MAQRGQTMNNKDRVIFSSVGDESMFDSDSVGIAYIVAVPKKFWKVSEWRLINGFLSNICGFLLR